MESANTEVQDHKEELGKLKSTFPASRTNSDTCTLQLLCELGMLVRAQNLGEKDFILQICANGLEGDKNIDSKNMEY